MALAVVEADGFDPRVALQRPGQAGGGVLSAAEQDQGGVGLMHVVRFLQMLDVRHHFCRSGKMPSTFSQMERHVSRKTRTHSAAQRGGEHEFWHRLPSPCSPCLAAGSGVRAGRRLHRATSTRRGRLDDLLEDNLDLVRWRGNPRLDLEQLQRLVKDAPEQARTLIATEGYYSPKVSAGLDTSGAHAGGARDRRPGPAGAGRRRRPGAAAASSRSATAASRSTRPRCATAGPCRVGPALPPGRLGSGQAQPAAPGDADPLPARPAGRIQRHRRSRTRTARCCAWWSTAAPKCASANCASKA